MDESHKIRVSLIILAVCWLGVWSFSSGQHRPADSPLFRPDTVELDNINREKSLPISQDILEEAPPILEIPVTGIENENEIGLTIRVALKWACKDSLKLQENLVEIGNFSLFPANQTGIYTLRTSRAFAQIPDHVRHSAEDSSRVSLHVKLGTIHKSEVLKDVIVELAPPRWRFE